MKRFRITLIAVSLILIYLGASDVRLAMRNTNAQTISIAELASGGEHIEKLVVTGGYYDLKNAVSTSGSVKLDTLLVPLTEEPGQEPYRVFVETREPAIMDLVEKYNFQLDSDPARLAFFEEHKAEFYPRRDVSGMKFSSVVANTNEKKLVTLLTSVGLKVQEPVIFIAEGKEPPKTRGIFFLIIGALGLLKGGALFRKAKA